MDDKELCNLACNPSLDGYTPNPLYHAGYCPDYMQNQCYADGSMFEEQWNAHQSNIKDFNARKMLSMTFHQRPQEYRYMDHAQAVPTPPSTSTVYQAMFSKVPIHPAVNTLPTKTCKKKGKKGTTNTKKSLPKKKSSTKK